MHIQCHHIGLHNYLVSPVCILFMTISVAERPQHMLMRLSVGIHGEDIDAALEVPVSMTCTKLAVYYYRLQLLRHTMDTPVLDRNSLSLIFFFLGLEELFPSHYLLPFHLIACILFLRRTLCYLGDVIPMPLLRFSMLAQLNLNCQGTTCNIIGCTLQVLIYSSFIITLN